METINESDIITKPHSTDDSIVVKEKFKFRKFPKNVNSLISGSSWVAASTVTSSQLLREEMHEATKKVKDRTANVASHMQDATKGAGHWMANKSAETAKAAMDQAKSGLSFGEKFSLMAVENISKWSRSGFTHVMIFAILAGYTALGAVLYIAFESPYEIATNKEYKESKTLYQTDLEQAKDALVVGTWNIKEMGTSVNYTHWEKEIRELLTGYDRYVKRLATAPEPVEDESEYVWTFWKAMFFCSTITTTIGYGHISPNTNAGRALTIVYAIVGIPIFLILMADFGKLFTRLLKSLFVFIGRLYRSATCRRVRKSCTRVRKTPQIQHASGDPPLAVCESLSGDLDAEAGEARRRTPRHQKDDTDEQQQDDDDHKEEGESCCVVCVQRIRECWGFVCRSKKQDPEADVEDPQPDDYMVDDNFNLPISLALLILLIYIFAGCIIYTFWESWTYFEAFYFIFISMTTIGFGDYVPEDHKRHPAFMMMTTVYLVFGLALTAMCINIIQEKLSDTFRRASEKLKDTMAELMAAATINEEQKDAKELEAGEKVEVAEVHSTVTKKDEKDGVKKEK